MRVLVIEDDVEAAEVLAEGLSQSGHQVVAAGDGAGGLEAAAAGGIDVIILDRMLPDGDGLDVLERLRARRDGTPVVFLTALGEIDQRVRGLKAGGDDYLGKPYALAELLARMEAVVRRREAQFGLVIRVGDLEIDLIARTVSRDGTEIVLQPREFRLLEFLARRTGQTVTRSMLVEGVWGYAFDAESKVIEVQLSRLRQKIDRGFEPPLIHTVRGVGYCLRATDPAS